MLVGRFNSVDYFSNIERVADCSLITVDVQKHQLQINNHVQLQVS